MMNTSNLNWIVVPGGPGLSANYLKHGFNGAFTGYKLHYYDPLGTPEVATVQIPTIDELVSQIFEVAAIKKFTHFGLITHSFGNYIAMRALERVGHNHNIAGLIMVSPMPFTFRNWKSALQNIVAKAPKVILERIQKLAQDANNGTEIFALFYPYYTAKRSVAALPHIPFNFVTCNQIAAQVNDYDDTNLLLSCSIPWVYITGEHDPFYLERDLLPINRINLIAGVGHYPFFEDHAAFVATTKNLEEKIF